MELAGISSSNANATSSCLSFIQNFSLENSASNQKTIRIVKEQVPRWATPHHDMTLIGGTLRHETGGGANRDRTGDLLVANQTLSQLSYGPLLFEFAVGAGGSG